MLRNLICGVFVIVTCGLKSQVVVANTCDGNSWALFLAKAQSIAPEAETLGQSLVACPREDYREGALYWLSFVFHRTDQSAKTDALMSRVPPPGSGEKANIKHRAWISDPSPLRAKVQSGESNFADDPAMLLALARTSMRHSLFQDGLLYFDLFLKQNENQESVEAERLYAIIWSGDREAALLQIASLKRFELSPYLQQVVQRAESLLGKNAESGSWVADGRGYWLHLAGVQQQDNRGYGRSGLEASYRGPFDLDVYGFETRHPLDEQRRNHAAFQLGKTFGGDKLRWQSQLGYWISGPEFVTGALRLEGQAFRGVRLGVGLQRQAVTLIDKPTLGEREGLMRDTAEWMLALQPWFVWQSSINREDSTALFEVHQVELRYGDAFAEEWRDGFGFFTPIRYLQQPKPSRDRLTFPRELRVGFGFRFVVSDGTLYRLASEALLESIDRSSYPDPDSFRKLLGTRVKVDARYFLSRSLYGQFVAEMSQTERDAFEEDAEKATKLLLGVGLRERP